MQWLIRNKSVFKLKEGSGLEVTWFDAKAKLLSLL